MEVVTCGFEGITCRLLLKFLNFSDYNMDRHSDILANTKKLVEAELNVDRKKKLKIKTADLEIISRFVKTHTKQRTFETLSSV